MPVLPAPSLKEGVGDRLSPDKAGREQTGVGVWGGWSGGGVGGGEDVG